VKKGERVGLVGEWEVGWIMVGGGESHAEFASATNFQRAVCSCTSGVSWLLSSLAASDEPHTTTTTVQQHRCNCTTLLGDLLAWKHDLGCRQRVAVLGSP
jgi:hypothetical protein